MKDEKNKHPHQREDAAESELSELPCWINLSDQLPDVGQAVWYYFEFVGVWPGKYFGMCEIWEGAQECGEDHHFGGDHGNLVGDVTHWMPLTDTKPNIPS
jgi:hypothetical protein